MAAGEDAWHPLGLLTRPRQPDWPTIVAEPRGHNPPPWGAEPGGGVQGTGAGSGQAVPPGDGAVGGGVHGTSIVLTGGSTGRIVVLSVAPRPWALASGWAALTSLCAA